MVLVGNLGGKWEFANLIPSEPTGQRRHPTPTPEGYESAKTHNPDIQFLCRTLRVDSFNSGTGRHGGGQRRGRRHRLQ